MENLYVDIRAKRVKGHDKLRVKDNQALSQNVMRGYCYKVT